MSSLRAPELKRLNEQVRRNRVRFPEDFAFQIAIKELGRVAKAAHRLHGARKLETLEKSVASLAEVYRAVRALMTPTVVPSRPVGFTADLGRRRDGAR